MITTVNKSERLQLYILLNSYLKSLNRRGITVQIIPFSGVFATVRISVTGMRGIVERYIIIGKSESTMEWQIVAGSKEIRTYNLNEVSTIAKTLITNLTALINKI